MAERHRVTICRPKRLDADTWLRLGKLTGKWYGADNSPLWNMARVDPTEYPRTRLFILNAAPQEIGGWAVAADPAATRHHQAEIHVFVHPDHRRQGIGTRLVEKAAWYIRQCWGQEPAAYGNVPATAAWYRKRGITERIKD